MSGTRAGLLFGIDDRPPAGTSLLAGLQHLMAIFGGIVTAPLIIARGMNLSLEDTNYLITSALLISGVATWIQISRIGVFGSGLLSIQGTSFTFIGPILFAFYSLPETMLVADKLGIIFGSAAVAAVLMMPICFYMGQLRRIFTPAVVGATVILLGTSLVWTTLGNLGREYTQQQAAGIGWQVPLLATIVFSVTLAMALSRNTWLRMTSIVAGLGLGYLLALALGQIDFSPLSQLANTFVPMPLRFGLGFDWGVLLVLMPVFIVSATESIGDLTATSALSKLPTSGPAYQARVRGGLLGDCLNSLIAALFATFPNTTFSQNNGVIRLTGIASKRIGYVVAVLLVVLGVFPVVGGLFQLVPGAVLYGATLLMFILVGLAGVSILQHGGADRRAWGIAGLAIAGGWALSQSSGLLSGLPDQLQMMLAFPVSTGAFLAILLEMLVPDSRASGRQEKDPDGRQDQSAVCAQGGRRSHLARDHNLHLRRLGGVGTVPSVRGVYDRDSDLRAAQHSRDGFPMGFALDRPRYDPGQVHSRVYSAVRSARRR